MVGLIPGLVGLGCIRKAAGQASKQHSSVVCAWIPALTSPSDRLRWGYRSQTNFLLFAPGYCITVVETKLIWKDLKFRSPLPHFGPYMGVPRAYAVISYLQHTFQLFFSIFNTILLIIWEFHAVYFEQTSSPPATPSHTSPLSTLCPFTFS